MLRSLVCWLPAVACAIFLACTAAGEVDTCDPGYVAAKMQAIALECRAARMRECPGVDQEAYERNPALCPAVTACYAEIDREAVRCVGR